jgi:sec-independent protein translocase protein TatC
LAKKNKLVSFLIEFRKSIRALGAGIIICSLVLYLISPILLLQIQNHLNQKLAFFSIAGPFLGHCRLAFTLAIFCLMPWIVYCFWKALVLPFKLSEKSLAGFILFTCLLFYLGAGFCFFVTLPFGINFLLGFESTELKPVISINRFITFVTVFVLAFGVIFELPIFMVFAGKTGLIPKKIFSKHRRYAILAISIIAAMLTPTPDVVNMLLMGGPLYLLYEMGIIILTIMRIE